MISNKESLRELNNYLIKKFKVKKPVVLKFCKLKDSLGGYIYSYRTHYIFINKKDNLESQLTSLNHEFAHLLQRNKWTKEEHSNEWGINVARVYRAILEYINRYT